MRAKCLMGNLNKSERPKLFLRISQNALIGRIDRQETSGHIGKCNADSRIVEHGLPPRLGLTQRFFFLLSVVNVGGGAVPVEHPSGVSELRRYADQVPTI